MKVGRAPYPGSARVPCDQCVTPFWRSARRDGLPLKRYCSRACYDAVRQNPENRDIILWERIAKKGPDDCWIYSGATDRRGYGRPGYYIGRKPDGSSRNKRYYAHRRVYELLVGPIPAGKILLHSCDNPPCCNPAHLSVGTDADNHRDSKLKDRNARGSRNGWAQLTEAQVGELRASYTGKRGEQVMLARRYGISTGIVCAIVNGKTWKHVLSAPNETK